MTSEDFERVIAIAKKEAGLFFPDSKKAFVASRLQRRLRAKNCKSFDEYVSLLSGRSSESELSDFVSSLTTNVTSIFREPHHFILLADHLESWSAQDRKGTAKYKIWSAGCSTGEEALSIAATCLAVLGPGWSDLVDIRGTDVDRTVVDRAKSNLLTPQDVEELKAKANETLQPRTEIRPAEFRDYADLKKPIHFSYHNLVNDNSVSPHFDAIFCRNVTIYFDQHSQKRVHETLVRSLRPSGLLFLGHSERLMLDPVRLTTIGRTAFSNSRTASLQADREGHPCH